jgi:hypothetical protein
MARRKGYDSSVYHENPFWIVSYEYQFKKDLIVPGTKLKIKGERGEFTFQRMVYHKEKDVTWIDCFSMTGYRSFYIDRLNRVIKPKKFRKKKNVEGN